MQEAAELRMSVAGRAPISKRLRVVSILTVFVMFLVLLMGALVTNSGSAEGCGSSWPLCDGKLLPAANAHSIIEYSHRAVSGIAGILVVLMTVWAVREYRFRPEIPFLMYTAVFFIVVQALLGAAAVMWPQPDLVLALHFGISLTAFAAVLLPTILMFQMERGTTHRSKPISKGLIRLVWFSVIYVYVIVYSGAYVRHTNSHLACLDWPLCNGALIPELSGAVGIQFAHRVAAALGLVFLAWLFVRSRRERDVRPDIYLGSAASFGLIALQVLSGAYVVLSHLTLTAMMVHSAVITLLFGALSYLCLQALPEYRPREREAAAKA